MNPAILTPRVSLLVNFGALVRFIAIDTERGLLVEIADISRNGIGQGGAGERYYADPAKCRRAVPGFDYAYGADPVPYAMAKEA